ncbi:MAG: hypothetical protein LBU32_15530 [Clostridiales bacterium]|nr:hypothetical protein [Clostridiales bacterium]
MALVGPLLEAGVGMAEINGALRLPSARIGNGSLYASCASVPGECIKYVPGQASTAPFTGIVIRDTADA